jgi:AAA domain
MAINLASLKPVQGGTEPPRILLYGQAGIGKTTLASEFPAPVFIQTETGIPAGITAQVLGGRPLVSYGEIVEAIQALLTEQHSFGTVIFDHAGGLERMIQDEVCARNKWKSIEQPGYGKGYKECDYLWNEFMEGVERLRNSGMASIITAHSVIDRFDDPSSASYNRYGIDLHKRSVAILERGVDAILLIKQEVAISKEEQGFGSKRAVGQSGELRWIYSTPSAQYTAKNRYNLPDRLPYPRGQGFAQLAPYLRAARNNEPPPAQMTQNDEEEGARATA